MKKNIFTDSVIREALVQVEVEDEDETASVEGHHFVAFMLPGHKAGVAFVQPSIFLFGEVHRPVPVVQELVLQQVVLDEAPLTTRIVERLVVSDSWEVQPFWVTGKSMQWL